MNRPLSVFVVGPGARFLSGISYYTASVARALQRAGLDVNVLLIRKLCPQRMYPGRRRVGSTSNDVLSLGGVPHREGLDWYGGASLIRALKYLQSAKPEVLLLNWWTIATGHNYLVLALVARRMNTRVFIEYHEIQDVSEGRLVIGRLYLRLVMATLGRCAAGAIVHSRADEGRVRTTFPSLRSKPILVTYHPPNEHGRPVGAGPADRHEGIPRLLFFGVIRPYKGLEDLVEAVRLLRDRDIAVSLTVAGEPWKTDDPVFDQLREFPHVQMELGYVDDDRVADLFASTDVVVLPYRRASASGPISIAMGSGLPIVTTKVPSIEEVLDGYGGAVLATPGSPDSLAEAVETSIGLVGKRFPCPHTWDGNSAAYCEFFGAVSEQVST